MDLDASIPASVVVTIGVDVIVLDPHDVRSLIRSLGEAARTLDGNRHVWLIGGTA